MVMWLDLHLLSALMSSANNLLTHSVAIGFLIKSQDYSTRPIKQALAVQNRYVLHEIVD